MKLNALEQSKYYSDDIETIKEAMLKLRIMKCVKFNPDTNMLIVGTSHYEMKFILIILPITIWNKQMDKFVPLCYNLKAKFDKFIKYIAERLPNPKTKEKYKELKRKKKTITNCNCLFIIHL